MHLDPRRGTRGILLLAAAILALPFLATGAPGQEEPTIDPDLVAKAVEEYLANREDDTESVWEALGEKLSLYGDLRLRHESSVERDGQDDRHRDRIRFRLGMTYDLHPELEIGARMVTGNPDDPNSTHVTIGNGFDSFELSLDRAYAKYSPEWFGGSWLVGGKFSHAFRTNPVYGELVWDGDIQPEGAAAGYTWRSEDGDSSLGVVLGQYALLEQGNASNTSISVAQVSSTTELTDDVELMAALGYSHYGSTSPDGSLSILADNQGNQLVDQDGDTIPDAYASKFGILNPIVSVSTSVADIPVTFAGEFIVNVRTGDRKNGWALGTSVGKLSEPGDWKFDYQWQVVEQESVFSAYANDDFLLTTNTRGHLVAARYRWLESATFRLWALSSSRDHRGTTPTTDSDSPQWNLRLDLDIKF